MDIYKKVVQDQWTSEHIWGGSKDTQEDKLVVD